jgi:hypothetical protein
MQLLGQLHSRTRERNPAKPQPALTVQDPTSSVDALVHQVRNDVESVPGTLRDVGAGALRMLSDPRKALGDATRYGRSLRRVLSPPDAPGSPLLAKRSMTWRFLALDVPWADLKAAGKAAGGSLNDAFLAALLGGYRRYHEAMGAPVVDAIPLGIPISVRAPGDTEGGNRIASARISGPMSVVDPRARIEEVRALILSARAEPAVNMIGLVSPALARLPGPMIAQLAAPMTKGNDLQASNVPGLPGDLYLAGARIERMYGFGPLPGCAAMVALITHGTVGCVAVNYDAASFTERKLWEQALADGYAEVLALHPGAGKPVVRI